MLCTGCQKEARDGKVKKGQFFCSKCLAAAKKSELQRVIQVRHANIGKMIERAQTMIYTAQNDLFNLKEFLRENGMKIEDYPVDVSKKQ